MNVTEEVLNIAVKMCRPRVKWSLIAGEMQQFCESAGFAVVKDYVGHGIGSDMHEDPKVPNFVSEELLKNDIVLCEGMVLAVEPMINSGSFKVRTKSDGWVVVTADGNKSAHYEHTIAILDNGCKVLTLE
jgi:methionyl aminopeptidase